MMYFNSKRNNGNASGSTGKHVSTTWANIVDLRRRGYSNVQIIKLIMLKF